MDAAQDVAQDAVVAVAQVVCMHGARSKANDMWIESCCECDDARFIQSVATIKLSQDELKTARKLTRMPWWRLKQSLESSRVCEDVENENEIVLFLQWVLFKNPFRRKVSVDAWRKLWKTFKQGQKEILRLLPQQRDDFYSKPPGSTHRLHTMCLDERIACAVSQGICPACSGQSPKFNKLLIHHPDFANLSQELQRCIREEHLVGVDQMAREINDAVAILERVEQDAVVKYVDKRVNELAWQISEVAGAIDTFEARTGELAQTVKTLASDVETYYAEAVRAADLAEIREEDLVQSSSSEDEEDTVKDIARVADIEVCETFRKNIATDVATDVATKLQAHMNTICEKIEASDSARQRETAELKALLEKSRSENAEMKALLSLLVKRKYQEDMP